MANAAFVSFFVVSGDFIFLHPVQNCFIDLVGDFALQETVTDGDDEGNETIDWNHVAAFRMMKEEIIYTWLGYISDVIVMFFANMGKRTANRRDFFQEKFPDQLWVNISNFIENLYNLPLWKSPELSSTIFGGKQVYNFWRTIFDKGVSPTGESVLAKPIDIKAMILPPLSSEA